MSFRLPADRAGWRLLFGTLILAAAAFWIFAPSLGDGRLWDDGTEVFANPVVRSPAPPWKAWTAPEGPDYLPLKTSIEWLGWRLWGDSPEAFRVCGVLLHLIAALLLWRLLLRLGLRAAWFGALIFVVHPVAVASVAWIAELKNTLSLPLLLLALLRYLAWDERGRRSDYWLAVVLFTAGMLTKTSVVMMPLVVLLHQACVHGRLSRRTWSMAAPLLLIALVLGLLGVHFQESRAIGPAGPFVHASSLPERAGRALLALGFYLQRCLAPQAGGPVFPAGVLGAPARIGLVAWAATGAAVAALRGRRTKPGRSILLVAGFFALNLLPAAGLIPMSYLRIGPVADHFAYIALISVGGCAAAAAGALTARLGRIGGLAVRAGGLTVAVLLAVIARGDAACYHDERAFWRRAAEGAPDNGIVLNNLGSALLHAGHPAEARAELEQAVRLQPRSAEARVNLATALDSLGDRAGALAQCEQALELEPDFGSAHYALANVLVHEHRLSEAVGHYRTAARLEPDTAEIRYNLGNALAESGALEESLGPYSEAVRLDPENAAARVNYGIALATTGRMAEAQNQFATAVGLRPDSADAQYCLADALASLGKAREAIPHFEAALRLRPGDPEIAAGLQRARAADER